MGDRGQRGARIRQVEAIRAWIQSNLAYRYGSSDASTDAVATLERGAGVCRDFAHVGMALTRALRIPARMVVGYLLGLEPMDLHAWFEAYVGGRWYTFDATQVAARGGRVVLAYGGTPRCRLNSNYSPADDPMRLGQLAPRGTSAAAATVTADARLSADGRPRRSESGGRAALSARFLAKVPPRKAAS